MRKASASPRIMSAHTANLANSLLALQRFDEARQTIRQAEARKVDVFLLHNALYALSFLGADFSGMEEQLTVVCGQARRELWVCPLHPIPRLTAGHVRKARELSKQSVDSAIRADSKETGAIWQEIAAQREAAFGNATEAKQASAQRLETFSNESGC